MTGKNVLWSGGASLLYRRAVPGATLTAEADYGDGTGWQPATLSTGPDDQYAASYGKRYPTTGPRTVTVRLLEAGAEVLRGTVPVTVGDAPPTLPGGVTGPGTLAEGTEATFGVNPVDPAGGAVAVEWDFDYAGTFKPSGLTGASVPHRFPDNGTFVVAARATANGSPTLAQRTVTVTNAAPVVNLGPPRSVTEGDVVTLDAADFVTDAGTGDTHTYLWTVTASNGQVVPVATAKVLTFAAEDDGIYTVALTATDNDGDAGVGQVVVTAANAAPGTTVSGPSAAADGEAVTFTATLADRGQLDGHDYVWTAAVGGVVDKTLAGHLNPGEPLPALTFTPSRRGAYVVTLAVTDGVSAAPDAVAKLAVGEVRVSAPAEPLIEGAEYAFHGVYADAGTGAHAYRWEAVNAKGDVVAQSAAAATPLAPEAAVPEFRFTPADRGQYFVRLTVSDEAGGAARQDAVAVTAGNAAPTVPEFAAEIAPRGAAESLNVVTLTGRVADAGAAGRLTARLYFTAGDKVGVPLKLDASGNFAVDHAYPDGSHEARVVVSDGGDGDDPDARRGPPHRLRGRRQRRGRPAVARDVALRHLQCPRQPRRRGLHPHPTLRRHRHPDQRRGPRRPGHGHPPPRHHGDLRPDVQRHRPHPRHQPRGRRLPPHRQRNRRDYPGRRRGVGR